VAKAKGQEAETIAPWILQLHAYHMKNVMWAQAGWALPDDL
jgi:hypothetical protein